MLLMVLFVAIPSLVSAECGWLLLMPPLAESKINKITWEVADEPDPLRAGVRAATVTTLTYDRFLNKTAELREWVQSFAFDSADDCERGRSDMLKRADAERKKARESSKGRSKKTERRIDLVQDMIKAIQFGQQFESRCLPASTVYPQKP
jgi:hypothetical protein